MTHVINEFLGAMQFMFPAILLVGSILAWFFIGLYLYDYGHEKLSKLWLIAVGIIGLIIIVASWGHI